MEMSDDKHKVEVRHKEMDYSREVVLTCINYSIGLKTDDENESLDYMVNLGLSAIDKMKKLEDDNDE